MTTASPWDTSATWSPGTIWQTTEIGVTAWPGLATLDNLKSAMARFLQDNDFLADYDLFIRLFEAEASATLRLRCLETIATADLTSATIGLPDGFRGVRRLWLTGYPPLRSVELEELADIRDTNAPGRPTAYCIVGQVMLLAPVPSGSWSGGQMIYYFQVPALVSANPTNVLLASHPQLYLLGSLKYAEEFLRDDNKAGRWAAMYEAAKARAELADKAERRTYGPLVRATPSAYRE
jgi:hypothetical protein